MKHLITLLMLCILSACAFAQDRTEEHYTLHGNAECDTVLSITTDAPLDYSVAFPDGRLLVAGSVAADETADIILPTGRTNYTLFVSHEGAMWSYDLRVECPPSSQPEETEAPEAHSLGEALTQGGIDPTRGAVVTAVPVRTP